MSARGEGASQCARSQVAAAGCPTAACVRLRPCVCVRAFAPTSEFSWPVCLFVCLRVCVRAPRARDAATTKTGPGSQRGATVAHCVCVACLCARSASVCPLGGGGGSQLSPVHYSVLEHDAQGPGSRKCPPLGRRGRRRQQKAQVNPASLHSRSFSSPPSRCSFSELAPPSPRHGRRRRRRSFFSLRSVCVLSHPS